MESQRFEKSRGEGVVGALPMPNSDPSASPAQAPVQSLVQTDDAPLCQYRDARGRGCRMLAVTPPNPMPLAEDSADVSTEGLCAFHARRLRDRQRAGQTAAAELLASITDFGDAASVNRFLGNLAKMVALRRIPRRDAIVLAYISQLILNSQAANDRSELLRYQLQLLREKNTPVRVVWDLLRRHREPGAKRRFQTGRPDGSPDRSPNRTMTRRNRYGRMTLQARADAVK